MIAVSDLYKTEEKRIEILYPGQKVMDMGDSARVYVAGMILAGCEAPLACLTPMDGGGGTLVSSPKYLNDDHSSASPCGFNTRRLSGEKWQLLSNWPAATGAVPLIQRMTSCGLCFGDVVHHTDGELYQVLSDNLQPVCAAGGLHLCSPPAVEGFSLPLSLEHATSTLRGTLVGWGLVESWVELCGLLTKRSPGGIWDIDAKKQ